MPPSALKALLLVVVSAAAACGGGTSGGEKAPPAHLLVPPIRAVDRSLPASAFGRNVAFIRNGCLEVPLGRGVGPPPSCEPGREDLGARAPTPQTQVHLLARLPLSRPKTLSQQVFFAVYRSRGLGTCFTIVFAVAVDPLTCDGGRRCAALCLRSFPEGREFGLGTRGTGTYTLVAGTVPSGAKALRLRLRNGVTLTYALRGPLARGLPGRRIFMADLGRRPGPARVGIAGG